MFTHLSCLAADNKEPAVWRVVHGLEAVAGVQHVCPEVSGSHPARQANVKSLVRLRGSLHCLFRPGPCCQPCARASASYPDCTQGSLAHAQMSMARNGEGSGKGGTEEHAELLAATWNATSSLRGVRCKPHVTCQGLCKSRGDTLCHRLYSGQVMRGWTLT